MPNKKTEYVIIGGVVTAVVDGALEIYFSEIGGDRTHPLFLQPLTFFPPVDDMLVVGIPAVLYAVAKSLKNEKLKNAAFGGLLYGGAMFVKAMMRSIHDYSRLGMVQAGASPTLARTPTRHKTAPQPQHVLFV